jgi:hypothetical protein
VHTAHARRFSQKNRKKSLKSKGMIPTSITFRPDDVCTVNRAHTLHRAHKICAITLLQDQKWDNHSHTDSDSLQSSCKSQWNGQKQKQQSTKQQNAETTLVQFPTSALPKLLQTVKHRRKAEQCGAAQDRRDEERENLFFLLKKTNGFGEDARTDEAATRDCDAAAAEAREYPTESEPVEDGTTLALPKLLQTVKKKDPFDG